MISILYHIITKTAIPLYQNCGFCLAEKKVKRKLNGASPDHNGFSYPNHAVGVYIIRNLLRYIIIAKAMYEKNLTPLRAKALRSSGASRPCCAFCATLAGATVARLAGERALRLGFARLSAPPHVIRATSQR